MGTTNYSNPFTSGDHYTSDELGSYQYIELKDIIFNFMATHVGPEKILGNTLAADVSFHAHRALQELSYDTLRSCKSQEFTVCNSLTQPLPKYYINYVKLAWIDSNGIKHPIYPTMKSINPSEPLYNTTDDCTPVLNECVLATSGNSVSTVVCDNPDFTPVQDSKPPFKWYCCPCNNDESKNLPECPNCVDGVVNGCNQVSTWPGDSYIQLPESTSWKNYKTGNGMVDGEESDLTLYKNHLGKRYGLDPQHSNGNGTFFIDCHGSKIHFSSNLAGKTVVIEYISDRLSSKGELLVPKLAEEAIYKWIAHGCLSAKANVPEYLIARFKKERAAETRKAKIRLSNIKIEEITQIFRGKAKHIKH